MAVDTRNKRGSIIGLGLAIILPLSDGAIIQADRQQTAHAYSGILAEQAAVISPNKIFLMDSAPPTYQMGNIKPIYVMDG